MKPNICLCLLIIINYIKQINKNNSYHMYSYFKAMKKAAFSFTSGNRLNMFLAHSIQIRKNRIF